MPFPEIPGTATEPRLIGRDREFATLFEIAGAVRQRGAAVVVRGDAGIGKSALLRSIGRHAASLGLDVSATTAVQSEVDLPFAGLHQLLLPLLGTRGRLPSSSREAIDAAFGRGNTTVSSPFLVALATLQLLSERGDSEALLMLVDDAHWLDPASADALAFIARRIESEPIVIIFAIREGFDGPMLRAALPELKLQPLDEVAAGQLLEAHAPSLPPGIRERILADAAGNPLALVELPVAVRGAGLEQVLPPTWLPLTDRLTRIFGDRLSSLAASTRQFLLVAAADDASHLTEIIGAAGKFVGEDALMEAISESSSAGLIEVDGSNVRFKHPLMRSAVYDSARLWERQAVHAALAETVAADADRRAWHLANGVVGADDQVANALEEAARRASARAAITTALRMMDRAAHTTSDPAVRASRSLWAADLAVEAGQLSEALRILGQIKEHELRATDRPFLVLLRDAANIAPWSGASTVAGFANAADQLREQGEIGRAIRTLCTVSLRCWWSNPDEATRALMVAAADRLPLPDDSPERLSLFALAAPEERGAFVLERLGRILEKPFSSLPIQLLGVAATGVGHFAAAEQFLGAAAANLRADGSLGLLAQTQVSFAWTNLLRGNWKGAALSADEAIRLGEETGQPRWVAVAKTAAAVLAAYQGALQRAEALADDAEKEFLPSHANPMLALVQLARGAIALAAGRSDTAYEQLLRIHDSADVAHHPHLRSWALVDLVEAAVHSNRHADAHRLVEEQEALLNRTHWPLLREQVAAAKALLARDGSAEADFHHVLTTCLDASPFVRARVQLAYGAWLKRRRRAAESRPHLRASLQTFTALGGVPWAERARRELRASGETSRRAAPSTGWLALSPQELQIAQLAAEGLSNKEIARQLFLSHRTVGTHLYRIFPKLGITNRAQLQFALNNRATTQPALDGAY